MLEDKIWKTIVLVIDYPLSKEKELEKLLKPLAPKINTFGEIWEPHNGLKSEAVYAVLDNLDRVKMTQNIKAELINLIAGWAISNDDPDMSEDSAGYIRAYRNCTVALKKIVEKM